MGLILWWVNLRSSHSRFFLFLCQDMMLYFSCSWTVTFTCFERSPSPYTGGVIPIAPWIHGQPYITTLPFVQPDDELDHGLMWLKKWNYQKKQNISWLSQTHCTAMQIWEKKVQSHLAAAAHIYLAVKQRWNYVNQAVGLGDGREKPCWLFELQIRAPSFTSSDVSKLNQEGVKKHWTCIEKRHLHDSNQKTFFKTILWKSHFFFHLK